MNHSTDRQLLRDYSERRIEAAFTELVRRHVDFVYSAALRMVRDAHLAEDVTQGVFVALAKSARQLVDLPALEGWLHGTTRNLAANVVRTEIRRRNREQEATVMSQLLSAGTDVNWEHITTHLDEALDELSGPDRDALLLRYFMNRDFREVGDQLGISDDAAQKRVSRAVERLREFFAKRGVTVGASGLVAVITANAVQAAPMGLAVTISAAALAGTAATTSAVITATTKTIAMTTLQKTLVTLTVAVLAGAGIYEARKAAQLRDQVQTLQLRQEPLGEQIALLQAERDDAANLLAGLREENERLQRNTGELLRLRSEVGALRQSASMLSNRLVRLSNPYGLPPEQEPPIVASSVPETAAAYARLVKKLTRDQLSPAEEYNLAKAWPYLEKRFHEPNGFAFFQAEYLAGILELKDNDAKWELRRILEQARDKEHAQAVKWSRKSVEEIQSYEPKPDANMLEDVRRQWNDLNQRTTQQIMEILPEDEQSKLSSIGWPVLDFDPRLKSGLQASLSEPRFQNLDSQEVFDAFFPPNPKVRLVPAVPARRREAQ